MNKSMAPLIITLFFLAVIGGTGVSAFDFSELENKISEHTLDNGLKIIVMERHEAPVATFVTWANVGSVDDPKGYTGLAHMFEHMAFKGTTTLGSKDIKNELKLIAVEDSLFMLLREERNKGRLADTARITELTAQYEKAREDSYQLVDPNAFGGVIDREGGVGLNAGTMSDATVYFFSLPSNKAELWMALESERFLNPVLREMYKERDVVAEERRMRIESSPFGRMMEEYLGLAFKAHPYGITGIGHMSDIQYYSRKEAEAFFKKYYGPSNLTVAVAGDVKAQEIFKLAEKYFGRIPYRPAPPRIATVEPEQLGERREVMEDPAQPLYLAGWHVPETTHEDRPAVEAILDHLAGGRTSVLYKSLVKEKKIAIQVGGIQGFPGDKYPSTAVVYVVPSQGHTSSEAEAEVFAGVEQLKTELLTTEQLDGIKARAKANFINGGFGGGLASNMGMAIQLAAYQALFGDWRAMFGELDRINAVTAEDIQRVANEYFTTKNRVVVMMNTVES